MPIRPENRKRYPKNWTTEIVPAILAVLATAVRAVRYPECRAQRHQPHPVTGAYVRLTVAHLDHTPENCDPANLRAWCERCHNTYDWPHRRETRHSSREHARYKERKKCDDTCKSASQTHSKSSA
jgi:hypothetical protein